MARWSTDDSADGAPFGGADLRCASCGRRLVPAWDPQHDPDDEPAGDDGRPICGECARARHFMTLDLSDGDIDDRLD
jgi:hypothetical protein